VITARRYACCDRVFLSYRQEDLRRLDYGVHPITLDLQLVDGDCITCDIGKSLGRKPGKYEDEPIDGECLAGRHDFKLDADRLRGTDKYPGQRIYGTGGWDLCFRCTRQPCRASKYTTYGLEPLYLSDASGTKIYESERTAGTIDVDPLDNLKTTDGAHKRAEGGVLRIK
jgi:hypothetical protein